MICCDPISVSVNPISLKHMATSLIDQCHDLTDLYHPVRSKLQMIMPETRYLMSCTVFTDVIRRWSLRISAKLSSKMI